MRVIAGTLRGRPLRALKDLSIRPTTDRAKQAIFDVLTNRIEFDGIRVLDLFSGTGSLGIEALSRGAASVTFVEKARTSLTVLEQNLASLGVADRADIAPEDVFGFLTRVREPFDLIFADPPYKLGNIGSIPTAIAKSAAVREGTYVVMEHSRESAVEVSETDYDILRKPFGQTTALILRYRPPQRTTNE